MKQIFYKFTQNIVILNTNLRIIYSSDLNIKFLLKQKSQNKVNVNLNYNPE